jgi:hypothetical protein
MRNLVVGLVALTAMLNSRTADAQLIRFGDIIRQPAPVVMPVMGYESYSMDYRMYPMYSANDLQMSNFRMSSDLMMAEMLLANDQVLRSRANARAADWVSLIPIILQLFPDLNLPGIDVNDSSRLDRIEDKLDKLLAEHGIKDSDGGNTTVGNSGLANLIEQILGILQPGQSSRSPRSRSAIAHIPRDTRDEMIKALRAMLDDMKSDDAEDPKTAGDRLEAAVEKAEAAVQAANAEVIRARAVEKIEQIRRERDAELKALQGVKKELTLSERIEKQTARLKALNSKTTEPVADPANPR